MLKCKAMLKAKVSSKNQIVIPREAREALRLKAGDTVLMVVRNDRVLLMQKPRSHSAALRGLAKGSYPQHYLQKERDSWR